jgi:hypothetical protein
MSIDTQNKQTDLIRDYLDAGNTLTSLDALKLFSCFRLASRMHDLKKLGYSFNKEMISIDGSRKVAQYSKGSTI